MKCPHCDYFYGFDFDKGNIEPEDGEFYTFPIKMERESIGFGGTETKDLYACPKCRKTFIG